MQRRSGAAARQQSGEASSTAPDKVEPPSSAPAATDVPLRSGGKRDRWSRSRKALARADTWLILGTVLLCLALLRWASQGPTSERLFTKKQLAFYNGKKGSPLYLALLGEVFDVTKGAKHYGEGGGYHHFVGRDASLGFITGNFREDLTDSVASLSPSDFKALVEWRTFYHKEYTYKGRVEGRFYKDDGSPTLLLKRVEKDAKKAISDEEAAKKAEAVYPSCNMRWSEAEGGSVWCDGGKYPRKILQQLPGGKPSTRCACFAEVGWSDMRQIYPNCKPDAHMCTV